MCQRMLKSIFVQKYVIIPNSVMFVSLVRGHCEWKGKWPLLRGHRPGGCSVIDQEHRTILYWMLTDPTPADGCSTQLLPQAACWHKYTRWSRMFMFQGEMSEWENMERSSHHLLQHGGFQRETTLELPSVLMMSEFVLYLMSPCRSGGHFHDHEEFLFIFVLSAAHVLSMLGDMNRRAGICITATHYVLGYCFSFFLFQFNFHFTHYTCLVPASTRHNRGIHPLILRSDINSEHSYTISSTPTYPILDVYSLPDESICLHQLRFQWHQHTF